VVYQSSFNSTTGNTDVAKGKNDQPPGKEVPIPWKPINRPSSTCQTQLHISRAPVPQCRDLRLRLRQMCVQKFQLLAHCICWVLALTKRNISWLTLFLAVPVNSEQPLERKVSGQNQNPTPRSPETKWYNEAAAHGAFVGDTPYRSAF
jgi:hypothetical protein